MTDKKRTKTHLIHLHHRKIFKITLVVLILVVIVFAAITLTNWVWRANYHKDDLRTRPISKDFIYIGRNFRGRNISWFYNISGLRGLLGPSTETLYYTTDVAPENISKALPGSWHTVNTQHVSCTLTTNIGECLQVNLVNNKKNTGEVMYIPYHSLINLSEHYDFALKPSKEGYYIGVRASTMQYINPANVDPEVRKTFLNTQE